jgi:hypothetical protein
MRNRLSGRPDGAAPMPQALACPRSCVQIEHDREFVTAVDLPMQLVTTVAPVAQRIAPGGLTFNTNLQNH